MQPRVTWRARNHYFNCQWAGGGAALTLVPLVVALWCRASTGTALDLVSPFFHPPAHLIQNVVLQLDSLHRLWTPICCQEVCVLQLAWIKNKELLFWKTRARDGYDAGIWAVAEHRARPKGRLFFLGGGEPVTEGSKLEARKIVVGKKVRRTSVWGFSLSFNLSKNSAECTQKPIFSTWFFSGGVRFLSCLACSIFWSFPTMIVKPYFIFFCNLAFEIFYD